MLQMRLILMLSFLLITVTSGGAQQMNEPDSPCKVAGTSLLVACLSKARASSEAAMNSVYEKVKSRLDTSEIDQLSNTQRLWTEYRDSNCTAERSLYGIGTAASPAYLACIEAMTRSRTKELLVTYTVRLK